LAGPQEWRARPVRAAARRPSTAVFVLGGPLARADVEAVCERVRVQLEGSDADLVVCDVRALAPDAVTVDVLARLQLTARRLGRRVRFRHACDELQALLGLVGLTDVVPCGGWSGLEPSGEAEEREQARRVQEERDPGDATA
jgi:ABC-type transporter Mla MlaB component